MRKHSLNNEWRDMEVIQKAPGIVRERRFISWDGVSAGVVKAESCGSMLTADSDFEACSSSCMTVSEPLDFDPTECRISS